MAWGVKSNLINGLPPEEVEGNALLNDKPKETDMQNLADTLADDIAEELAKPEPQCRASARSKATKEENQIAALFRAGEHILRDRRHKLAQLEQSYRQRLIDVEVEHKSGSRTAAGRNRAVVGQAGFRAVILFDRKTYFDHVRNAPFGGAIGAKPGRWAGSRCCRHGKAWTPALADDLRWLAYMLATTFHETARTMQPIEEYGKGKGKTYGIKRSADQADLLWPRLCPADLAGQLCARRCRARP